VLESSWFPETRKIHHPDFQTAILKLENALASFNFTKILFYEKMYMYNLKLVSDYITQYDYKILKQF